MYIKILEKTYNNEVINESLRVSKVKFSHLFIGVKGTAVRATECPKIIVNAFVSGEGARSRNIITNAPLSVLVDYSDILKGLGWTSTTHGYTALPLGSLDLSKIDLILELKGLSAFAANDLTLIVFAVRLDDNMPILEYQYRSVPVDGITIPNVLSVYDVNVTDGIDNNNVSTLTFDKGDNMNVAHKAAFGMCQALSGLETANTWGLLHMDKDMEFGRRIKFQPTTAFNAFIVQYSSIVN